MLSCAQIAQSVEQRTENPRVGGSNPSLGTNKSIFYNSLYKYHSKIIIKSSFSNYAFCYISSIIRNNKL